MAAQTSALTSHSSTSYSSTSHFIANPYSPSPLSLVPMQRTSEMPRSSNTILAALPEDCWLRIAPHTRRVLLHQDDILHEMDSEASHVYFVERGMISLVMDAQSDSQVEAAVIGSEGVSGGLAAMGNQRSIHRALVQIPGKALRLPVSVLQDEWALCLQLQQLILNHSILLMSQVSQTVLCGRMHTIESRLSRWLLASSDRIHSDTLELTHEHIAHMLGARRPGVTIALGALQQAGLIECRRGQIVICDREKLEAGACECYATLREKFAHFEKRSCNHA